MEIRTGTTYRIVDGGTWHASFGSAYICDGGHRRFEVRIWQRKGRGYVKGVGGRDFTVVIPKLSFRRAYKLRRIGLLYVYRMQTAFLRKLALNPNRGLSA